MCGVWCGPALCVYECVIMPLLQSLILTLACVIAAFRDKNYYHLVLLLLLLHVSYPIFNLSCLSNSFCLTILPDSLFLCDSLFGWLFMMMTVQAGTEEGAESGAGKATGVGDKLMSLVKGRKSDADRIEVSCASPFG